MRKKERRKPRGVDDDRVTDGVACVLTRQQPQCRLGVHRIERRVFFAPAASAVRECFIFVLLVSARKTNNGKSPYLGFRV